MSDSRLKRPRSLLTKPELVAALQEQTAGYPWGYPKPAILTYNGRYWRYVRYERYGQETAFSLGFLLFLTILWGCIG